MTQYAYYDSTQPSPSRVIGWYDTVALTYPSLPSDADLLALTTDQWNARTTGFWAVSSGALVSYTPPVPLPIQAANALSAAIATGITITCVGNSGLNSTYALDATTLTQIGTVAGDFAAGLGLPGNLSTFTYPDINSVPRTFTGTQLVELYKAQRDLLFALNTQAAIMANGGSPTWPAQTATIA